MNTQPTYEEAMNAGRLAKAENDTAAVNEIAAYISANYPDVPTQEPQSAEATNLWGEATSGINGMVQDAKNGMEVSQELMAGLGNDLTDTAKEGAQQFMKNQAEGHQDAISTTQRAISQGARTGGELLWDVGKVGAQAWMGTWGQMLPPALIDATKEGVTEFGEWIVNNPVAQAGWSALSKGQEAWADFKEANPKDAEQLGTMVDTAFMLSPRAPLQGAANRVSEKALKLKSAATQQEFDAIESGVTKMLEPVSRRGAGKSTIQGWRGEKVYDPVDYEKEIINEVAYTPGVDPQLSYTENFNFVDDHIERVAVGLDDLIREAGNPKVDTTALVGELDTLVKTLPDMDEAILLTGDAQKTAQQILRKAENLIKNSDGTATGVLQVRRDLDKWIDKITKGKAYDSDAVSATTVATDLVRTALNTKVSDAVPLVGVEDHLRQMHLLYGGRKIIDEKAYDEGLTAIARLYQSVHRATGVSIPTTPLAQWATAAFGAASVAGLAAAPIAGPLVGAAGAVGLSAMGLRHYLKSPAPKKQLAKLLETTAEAIRTVQDPALAGQLRADRMLILNLMQEEPE